MLCEQLKIYIILPITTEQIISEFNFSKGEISLMKKIDSFGCIVIEHPKKFDLVKEIFEKVEDCVIFDSDFQQATNLLVQKVEGEGKTSGVIVNLGKKIFRSGDK